MKLGLVLAAVGISVTGQLLLKLGASAPIHSAAEFLTTLFKPHTLIALVAYAVSAILWIMVLSRVPLSYAYPLLALNYVLVVAVSAWFLGESVPAQRWIGVGVIMLGFVIAATS
jgi:multidrug transporter EmrE-like cation transporter